MPTKSRAATKVTASFEVKSWDEKPFDVRPDTAKLTTATVKTTYSGGIEGDALTEWLMAYAEDGTATFVGIERITGTIGDHKGSLVVQHVGEYRDGAAKAEMTVLSECGSGDLAGTTGRGDFVADPSGKVRLELSFA